MLVGVESGRQRDGWSIDSSLDELDQLARTAGADVVGRLTQKMERPSSTHYIGSGKMQELIELKQELNYDTVVINDELAPRQQRNLEEALEVKVIDRTALILDIFAAQCKDAGGQAAGGAGPA